jgi:flagellar basal-body rod modification protein FlgD
MATAPISNSSMPVAGSSVTNSKSGAMGKDDFMKLLVAQLKHQDPTSPTDMNGMTAQMTQFSMLEQMTNMSSASEASSKALARTEALSLLGRTVSYVAADKSVKSGTVENVDVTADKPTLTIDGATGILSSQLKSVQ